MINLSTTSRQDLSILLRACQRSIDDDVYSIFAKIPDSSRILKLFISRVNSTRERLAKEVIIGLGLADTRLQTALEHIPPFTHAENREVLLSLLPTELREKL